MIFDTGSALTWVPGKECQDLGCTNHPQYDALISESGNGKHMAHFMVKYGSGQVKGVVGKDDMSVGGVTLPQAMFGQVTKEEGLNKLFFAFDPEYIPHVCPADIAPQDALHLFPDGILRSEGAWLVYILIKLGLTIDQMNEALRKYPHFPRDCRIPPLRRTV